VALKYNYDYAYQVEILKLCVKDPTFLSTHPDVIQPQFFSIDYLMMIAQMITGFYDKEREIPRLVSLRQEAANYFVQFNVSPEIQQAVRDLIESLYTDPLQNGNAVRDTVCRFAQRQSLRRGLRDCLDLLEKDEDLEGAVDIVRRASMVGVKNRESWNFFREVHDIRNKLKDDKSYNPNNKILTGFTEFDTNTFGGIGVGEIWVVGAKPKGGKSTLMVNIACNAIYYGKKVYHYSFGDMNKMDVTVKYAQCFTGYTIQQMLNDQNYITSSVNRMVTSRPGAHLEIIYDSPGVMTVEDLYSDLGHRVAYSGVKPDLVVIDYANKMKHPIGDNTYRSMSLIYGGLKELGDAFNCGVLTGVQLRRDAERGDGKAEDVAESWLQIADCDALIIINQNPGEGDPGGPQTARLSMPIVRRGKTCNRLNVHFRKDIARIRVSGI
jgi:replicative DNA helicase